MIQVLSLSIFFYETYILVCRAVFHISLGYFNDNDNNSQLRAAKTIQNVNIINASNDVFAEQWMPSFSKVLHRDEAQNHLLAKPNLFCSAHVFHFIVLCFFFFTR